MTEWIRRSDVVEMYRQERDNFEFAIKHITTITAPEGLAYRLAYDAAFTDCSGFNFRDIQAASDILRQMERVACPASQGV
jgi:uncharacterized protein YecE (DUF72 family)